MNRNVNLSSFHMVVVLLYLLTQSKDTVCECDAPAVQEGHMANLTFKFNADVNTFQRDFRVDHYGFDNKGGTVLDCHWYNKETLECQKRSGYSYHENASNILIVHIKNASRQHMGTYKYSMMLPDQLYVIDCQLHVIVTDAEITTTLLPQKNSSHMHLSPLYIAFIVLGVMTLTLLIVLVYYICRRRKQRSDPQETRSKKRDLKCWKRGNTKEKSDYWLKKKRPSLSNAEDMPVEMKETDALEC